MPARKTKTDEALKRDVLAAALVRAAKDGFTGTMLAHSGKDADVAEGDIARLFPQGIASLLEFYSHEADAEMERRLGAMNLAAMPVRRRIATAVLTRLAVLKPDKDAACRAAAHLGLPHNVPLAGRLVYSTVDSMWRAAGDQSTDFNFYTKRGILAGVYTSTLLRWFNDTRPDERDTQAFLSARIENVMQYEKFKAQVRKDAAKGFDRLTALLRAAGR